MTLDLDARLRELEAKYTAAVAASTENERLFYRELTRAEEFKADREQLMEKLLDARKLLERCATASVRHCACESCAENEVDIRKFLDKLKER